MKFLQKFTRAAVRLSTLYTLPLIKLEFIKKEEKKLQMKPIWILQIDNISDARRHWQNQKLELDRVLEENGVCYACM